MQKDPFRIMMFLDMEIDLNGADCRKDDRRMNMRQPLKEIFRGCCLIAIILYACMARETSMCILWKVRLEKDLPKVNIRFYI